MRSRFIPIRKGNLKQGEKCQKDKRTDNVETFPSVLPKRPNLPASAGIREEAEFQQQRRFFPSLPYRQ